MDFDLKIMKRILETVKIDDGAILLGESIQIEKYGRPFEIKQINWFYDWEKFTVHFGRLINYFSNVCESFKMPANEQDIKVFRDNFRLMISNKIWGYRALGSLIKIMKIYKFDIKWMKKNFTIDDWMEFFVWIYIYNIFGVKKNLKNALSLISKVQSN
jgi:hypothetical protein